jgi:hypothetical protein
VSELQPPTSWTQEEKARFQSLPRETQEYLVGREKQRKPVNGWGGPAMFEQWCMLHDLEPVPAAPAAVAKFVADIAPLGIEKVWPIVQEISRAHYMNGLADPTLGGPVTATVNDIAKITLPRAWPKEQKGRFAQLPYDLQVYVAAHEAQRETALRRAQNETAKARQALAAIQKPEVQNGTTQDAAA